MTIQTELNFLRTLYYQEAYLVTEKFSSMRDAGQLREYLNFCCGLININNALSFDMPSILLYLKNVWQVTQPTFKIDDAWLYKLNTELIKLQLNVTFYFGPETEKYFSHTEKFDGVTSLSLHFITRLTGNGLRYIAENVALANLVISKQGLEYVSPNIFVLKHLEILKIDNNNLTVLPDLSKLSKLQILHINNNPLEIAPLKNVLRKLPESLRILHISKNQAQALPYSLPDFLKKDGVIKIVDTDLTLNKDNYRQTLTSDLESPIRPSLKNMCTIQ